VPSASKPTPSSFKPSKAGSAASGATAKPGAPGGYGGTAKPGGPGLGSHTPPPRHGP
jgi:hypothetical protein